MALRHDREPVSLVPPHAVASPRSKDADSSPVDAPDVGQSGLAKTLGQVERGYIVAALTRSRWVIEGPRGAAQLLKLHPNTLRSRMEKLGIRRSGHEIS